MVPPPNNSGDEFPDFDSMSPEEQMAWLESLARRQGAKPEEFTTSADMEIAEVSPDAVIDEPGYIPYSISEKPVEAKPETPPISVEPVPMPPVVEEPALMGADELPDLLSELEADAEVEEFEFPEEETDPMKWLGSLSAQTEADFSESTAIVEEDTAEFLAGLGEFEDVEVEGVLEPEPEASSLPDVELLAGIGDSSDPLGGMDPMLWLESLAKRQGVDSAELTTSADLEIEEPPEGTVIDEPGYVPYDVVAGGPRKAEEAPVVEPEPELLPATDIVAVPEADALFDEYEPSEVLDETLEGADPMEWLESLAKRQGAKIEELTTSANLDIPHVPKGTVVDEPGYVAFSPFGEVEERDEFQQPEPTAEPDLFVAETEAELGFEPELAMPSVIDDDEVDESLAWLADLASEPEVGVPDLFGAAAEVTEDRIEQELVAAGTLSDDILAGMTDEEIAYAQAHGQLTPNQELEWLKRQAAKLADVRQEAEEVLGEWGSEEEIELAPASPGQLPSWLEEMRSDSEDDFVKTEGAAVFEEATSVDSGSTDLGDWLNEVVSEKEADVSALSFDSDIDSLWAEINDGEVAAALDAGVIADASDLFAPDAVVSEDRDQLAEALDSEYERRLSGDDSEPEWYTQAVQQETGTLAGVIPAEEAIGEFDQIDISSAGRIETSDLTEAVPVDMPGWLVDAVDEPAVEPLDSDMPAWLTESLDHVSAPADTVDMPDWLTESPSSEADVSWLADREEKPAASEAPVPQPVVSIPQPQHVVPDVEPELAVPSARPLPQGELFVQYRQRLERNPNDHATRLALARALRTSNELEASLDQYENLIEVSQHLPDIGADLGDLVREHENEPRIRRLLGDTYMRKGMLQQALDAYRSALNRL